ncbi:MAG: hypothetical protein FJX72_08585, partial [Armatimonadetes bacterium]|nr:hypothetical protein [Armatimonadota bacterium]
GLGFEGVDFACHVFLNGVKLGSHEGTYTPFELDASAAIRYGALNRLVVVVEHAPSEPDQQAQIGWTSRVRLWKPRFAYKWDWCTRLVPLGIHDDVWLDIWDRARIEAVRAHADLKGSASRPYGQVNVAVVLDRQRAERLTVQAGVHDAAGACVARETLLLAPRSEERGERREEREAAATAQREAAATSLTARLAVSIDDPALWNPNGYGPQNLYTVRIEVYGEDGALLDSRTSRIGFRKVVAVANYGAPPDALPYTLEVNGRKVFLKGWNWAPIDQLYGRPKQERYRHAIRLAREANCNLLRVWGGGLLERECFYDLCDEAGIMIWQEFHQSSSGIDNEPARDDEYVAYCTEQAKRIVPRRTHHPSLVIWCGGNELMDSEQRPNDLTHPVLAALGEVVRNEDTERIYFPTSPSGPVFAADPANRDKMHDVHGHWLYLGNPEHYAFYNSIDPLLHSEFGCEGPANLRALETFLSPEYRWPPDRTNPAWIHHGSWWLHREKVPTLFGPVEDLRTFVFAGQWMQHEGLRYIAESNRRREWRTSGCAPWQLNESWPNASCTNSLDYYGAVRPAYWGMRGAYGPTLVSLRYDGLNYQPGGKFGAELWLNISLPDTQPSAVRWAAWDLQTCAHLGDGRAHPRSTEPGPERLGTVAFDLPESPCVFGVSVWADGEDASAANRYVFSTHQPPLYAPMLSVQKIAPVADQVGPGLLRLTCPRGTTPLIAVRADGLSGYEGPYLSWGYAPFLMPGEAIRIAVSGHGDVEVSALNADAITTRLP